MGEPLLQILQAPDFTSDDERRHLWDRAFDHFRPAMAYAHVSLVLTDAPRFRRGRRARALLRDDGPGAAPPMLDVDDFGEVLTVHVPLSDLPAFLPLTANLSPAPPDTRTMWQKQK